MQFRTLAIVLPILFLACQDSGKHNSTAGMTNTPSRPFDPEWSRNAVLYECNVRQFSPEGNFAGVQKQLPRLRDLGVGILWLMPVHPIGVERRKPDANSPGSPYSVRDYYAVNPDYGTVQDLKVLVADAHALGMKVILDWVPNHTSWDAVWKTEHPEYYTKINGEFTVPINEHGQPIDDWSDICDLDYNNRDLRRAMTEVMQFWIKTCDIDGYRVDMAGLVPNDFWSELRPALDSIKPVFMLSEWQDEPGHFTSCFNANYGWKWKDVTKDIAAGKQSAIALDTLLDFLNRTYPRDYYQLYFTQNHDENSWNGTEYELYGKAADAFNVLAFTWQGIPMIYCGQEGYLDRRLPFFERSPIDWADYRKTPFFAALARLKRNNTALHNGPHGGKLMKIRTDSDEQVYAFYRENDNDRVVVILNLSPDGKQVALRPPDNITGAYTDLFGNRTVQFTPDLQLSMQPWEYIVLTNKM